MKVKVGNQSLDSERVPVAFVLSPAEKMTFYNLIQDHLANKPDKPIAIMLAPDDIPRRNAISWLSEAVTEFEVDGITQAGGNEL